MKKPEQPTQEEIDKVETYWLWVGAAVGNAHGLVPEQPEQPTQKELERAARWRYWCELMACQHTNGITMSSFEGMICSDCGEQMHFLSETQIEEMKEKHNVE